MSVIFLKYNNLKYFTTFHIVYAIIIKIYYVLFAQNIELFRHFVC